MSSLSSRIGVDIGGSRTRVGLFAPSDPATPTRLEEFPTEQDYEAQLRRIIVAIDAMTTHYSAIGVSLGAPLMPDGRHVGVPANLPGYAHRALASDLERTAGCPVRVAQDPVCGLLAECRFGSIGCFDRCAYVTLSTGTSAALRLHSGATTLVLAMRAGHQIVDGASHACLCGQNGCLETITGGLQIQKRQGRSAEAIVDPFFWEHYYDRLGIGLVNIAQLTGSQAFALGGSIALRQPSFLTMVRQKVAMTIRRASPTITLAVLGDLAPLIGAVVLLDAVDGMVLH